MPRGGDTIMDILIQVAGIVGLATIVSTLTTLLVEPWFAKRKRRFEATEDRKQKLAAVCTNVANEIEHVKSSSTADDEQPGSEFAGAVGVPGAFTAARQGYVEELDEVERAGHLLLGYMWSLIPDDADAIGNDHLTEGLKHVAIWLNSPAWKRRHRRHSRNRVVYCLEHLNIEPTGIHRLTMERPEFDRVAAGQQTLQVRVLDTQARRIRRGNMIVFTCGSDTLTARVLDAEIYYDFELLVTVEDLDAFAIGASREQVLKDLRSSFTTAQEHQGVAVIWFALSKLVR